MSKKMDTHKFYLSSDEIREAHDYAIENNIPIVMVLVNSGGVAQCGYCAQFMSLLRDERFQTWLKNDCKYIWLIGGPWRP